VATEPVSQNADSDLMKRMMAMMTPDQLAQLNMPSAEKPAQLIPAVTETSSFLSSLNPFSQTRVPEQPSEERHIFNSAEEQAPVSAYDQTLQDFQNNPVNQVLPENPPAIDAFNQGYESRGSLEQIPHETYGQSQRYGTIDQQQQQYQRQQAYQPPPYQQQYSMQNPQSGFTSHGLIESQSANLVENYQNLPLPPAPIQMNTDNFLQQPINDFQQQPSFSQPEQTQESYRQDYNPLDSNTVESPDVPNFASNPYNQIPRKENLSFQENDPPSPITSDFSYTQKMPEQINEPLPEKPSFSNPDFNELRQEATLEEKLGQISESLPYNVNLSPTPRQPFELNAIENDAAIYGQNTGTYQNQFENQPSQYEDQPSQHEDQPSQNQEQPSQYEDEPNQNENQSSQYDVPSQYDNQPVNNDYSSYQAGARQEDIAEYDQKLDLETPVESQVGSFKPPDVAQRFSSKDLYESEYFEDDISSHSWLVFIFLSILCVFAFVGLMRRKFRKLGLAAAKGGRRTDRGATEGGFDAVYKPLNDDDMA